MEMYTETCTYHRNKILHAISVAVGVLELFAYLHSDLSCPSLKNSIEKFWQRERERERERERKRN